MTQPKAKIPLRRTTPIAFAAMVLWLLVARAVLAEAPAPQPLKPEQWRNLAPEQRHELRRRYLQSLPEAERRRLRGRAERFKSLPDSRKQELCQDFLSDRGYLPPACKQLLER